MGELIILGIAIFFFIIISCIIMIITNVLFDIFSAIIIFPTALMLVFGIIFGFIIAIKNTVTVYIDIYKGK